MKGLSLLATLILLVSAGSTGAQDPGVETSGADPLAVDSPSADIPESLRSPVIDFFAPDLTLQAHKLRGLRAEIAGMILGSPGGGNIAFEALATPLRGTGDRANVPLFIEIDGPTFLETNQRDTARVEVYAYALGAEKQIVSHLAEVFAVDVKALGEAVWQSGLKFYGHLDLPPGEYQLRILVRNYHSGAAALREILLNVPDFDRLDRPFVVPIFQPPSARDAWLAVRERDSPSEYPLWVGQKAVSPAVRPVLVAGRRSEAHVLAYGVPAGAAQARIELSPVGTGNNASAALEVVHQPAAVGEAKTFDIAFDTPEVTPGNYVLRVVWNGTASAPVPIVVLQQDTRERALLWTDLRNQLSSGIKVEEAAAPRRSENRERPAKRAQRQIRKLADGYRQALSLLGTDQKAAARSALLNLESSVLTEGTLELLTPAQMAVAEELSKGDVESLIPLIDLHDDLYTVYRQRSLYSLGFHAREIIELLADLYAERGGTRGSHIVAGRVLASLGGYLQAANLPSSSRRLYRRALEHDAHNLAALLGLATSYERYGDYSRTIATLEDLASAHPKSGEGLLRLAINLDRLGVRARARSLAERVLTLEAPEWVRSLAAQRLARILVETGDLDQAVQVLEKSLQEVPRNDSSIYLLAHVYDRQKQPYKSLELLDGVVPSRDSSPRKLYDSWPEGALHTVREELSDAAALRANLITKVLEPTSKAQ